MSLILFLKADQRDLFDAPVNVGPSIRGGKAVGAYTRTQKVAQRHPVFGEYSFKKPLHAAVAASGGVLHWSTSRKAVENRRDRMADNPAWANARIEKVTADTAHKYTTHTPDNRAANDNDSNAGDPEQDSELMADLAGVDSDDYEKMRAQHKAARDAADLDYAKNAPPDPDAAAMQRYAAGVRAEEARYQAATEKKIVFPKKKNGLSRQVPVYSSTGEHKGYVSSGATSVGAAKKIGSKSAHYTHRHPTTGEPLPVRGWVGKE